MIQKLDGILFLFLIRCLSYHTFSSEASIFYFMAVVTTVVEPKKIKLEELFTPIRAELSPYRKGSLFTLKCIKGGLRNSH